MVGVLPRRGDEAFNARKAFFPPHPSLTLSAAAPSLRNEMSYNTTFFTKARLNLLRKPARKAAGNKGDED
jgi:hypothetical protein